MTQIVHLFTYPGQLSFWFSSMTVGNHHRLQVPNLTPILCTLKTSLSTLQPYKKNKNKNKGGCVFTLSHIGPLSNHINFFSLLFIAALFSLLLSVFTCFPLLSPFPLVLSGLTIMVFHPHLCDLRQAHGQERLCRELLWVDIPTLGVEESFP